jgi:hypothetical protein
MCYTDSVQTNKHNLTLVVDEHLLREARKVALDRHTSVNQLVRQFLADLVDEAGRKRLARAHLMDLFEKGIVRRGDWKWNRDELYER